MLFLNIEIIMNYILLLR